jgi:hypothetical protein
VRTPREFRAIRRQLDEGSDIVRDWAFVPAGSLVGLQIADEDSVPA